MRDEVKSNIATANEKVTKRSNERITPLDHSVGDYTKNRQITAENFNHNTGAHIFLTRYTVHTEFNFVPQTAKKEEF